MTLVSASSWDVFRSSSSVTSSLVTCESEAEVITCDIHSLTTQFFSHAGLLPLADEETDQFCLTSIAGQETSPLQDLVTRNNVSKTYPSF